MIEVTCTQCGGSGKERRGQMTEGIDWTFDFSEGFKNYCTTQEQKDKMRDERIAFLKTLKPGDRFQSYGNPKQVLRVGMYDGWPFWRPTPAVSYVGALGTIEYAFYNEVGIF